MKNELEEPSFVNIIKSLWTNRFFILKIVFAIVAIGFFFAFASSNEYQANTKFLPQSSSGEGNIKGGSRLGGLASLAGINLDIGESNGVIPPTLYPDLVNNIHFRMDLLEAPITISSIKDTISYRDYYTKYFRPSILSRIKKYTIGLPQLIYSSIKIRASKEELFGDVPSSGRDSVKITELSEEDVDLLYRLGNQLSVTPDPLNGTVSLSFIMPEAKASAQMAHFAQELLQKQLINYKIKNAQTQLDFTQQLFEMKEREFNQVQEELAIFRDRNQGINTALALNELQRIESKYDLVFGVYSDLAQQLENAKLNVQKSTPDFIVIQPTVVPVVKHGPNRKLILIASCFVGLFLGCSWVFFGPVLKTLIGEVKQKPTS